MDKTHRYLVHFFKKFKYLDFAIPEFESLAEIHGTNMASLYDPVNPKNSLNIKDNNCIYVNLPSDKVA